MHEIIRDTPIYQEILREGWEEGIEEGREQGFKQGSLDTSRRLLLLITQKRFPLLAPLTLEIALLTEDESILEDIIGKITAAQSEDEAFFVLQEKHHNFCK